LCSSEHPAYCMATKAQLHCIPYTESSSASCRASARSQIARDERHVHKREGSKATDQSTTGTGQYTPQHCSCHSKHTNCACCAPCCKECTVESTANCQSFTACCHALQ
jgi:hypothetical protein